MTIKESVSKNDYVLKSYSYEDPSQSHFVGYLEYKGTFNPADYEGINWRNTSSSLSPIPNLKVDIKLECNEILHIKVTDANQLRWEPPFTISDDYKKEAEECNSTKSLSSYGFAFKGNQNQPFSFSLTSSDGEKYFDSENVHFLYSEYFINFGGLFTSDDIYGFGERYHELKLGEGIWTLWPNDTGGIHYDQGKGGQGKGKDGKECWK